MTGRGRRQRALCLVHLFPDLLNVYGDLGNVRAIVTRALRRGIAVEVDALRAGDRQVPQADIFLVGGGQDREQVAVGRLLEQHGDAIRDQVADGTALLAICGGYQSLGWSYRAGDTEIAGPGILDVRTEAQPDRLVGPVVARLADRFPLAAGTPRASLVGFENHSGRTFLGTGSQPLATVEVGAGNNALDAAEGILGLPGDGGLRGLRIGTYLHGPLLPRNPHVADALIAAGVAHGGAPVTLAPLDDDLEWRAHLHFAARITARDRNERRIPGWVHRIVDPPRSLIGF